MRAPAFDASDFVTQDELTAQLNSLSNSLAGKFGQPATPTPAQYVAADGNAENPFAATNAINNLSGVTITNADLTASEIPPLDYFPATSTVSVGYGGTGTSNAPSYGQLLLGNGSGGYSLVATSSLGISGGGSGAIGSGTQGQFAFYDVAGTTLSATSSLFLTQSGNLGIGTTSPFSTLSVAGNAYFSGSLTAPIQDTGGQVFNVKAYGATGNGVTDDSAAIQSAINAASSTGSGGTIYFPPGTYLINSQITFPNDGSSIPKQVNFRLTGAGGGQDWNYLTNYYPDAATLDLTYQGTGAKILSLGRGALEIDHLTMEDTGLDNTPFIYTTNTVLTIEDNTFIGSGSATQDAIVLGGTTAAAGGAINDAFQGYGTTIDSNYFTNLNRGVLMQDWANSIAITNNSWAHESGTRAIESDGDIGNPNVGEYIAGNTIEMNTYNYGIVFTNTDNSTITGNGFYDGGSGLVDDIYLSTSTGNTIVYGQSDSLHRLGGDDTSLTDTTILSGDLSAADTSGNGQVSTELAGGLDIKAGYNSSDTYPGQLTIRNATSTGYLNIGFNDDLGNGYIRTMGGVTWGKLLINPESGSTNGFVGIGTSSPLSKLTVAGGQSIGADYDTPAPTNGLIVEGNVGIGTTSPGSLLALGSTNGINFSIGTSTFSSTGGINLTSGCFSINGSCVGGSGGGGGSGTVGGSTAIGQIPFYAAVGSALTATSSLFISASGEVAIGTTTPTSQLAVAQAVNGGTVLTLQSGGTGVNAPLINFANSSGSTIGQIVDRGTAANSATLFLPGGDQLARLGITNSTFADYYFYLDGNGKLNWGTGSSGTTDTSLYREASGLLETQELTTTGIGIGTGNSAPTNPLQIITSGNSATTSIMLTMNSTGTITGNEADGIYFQVPYTNSGQGTNAGAIYVVKHDATAGDYGFDMEFQTRQNGQPVSEKMRITGAGSVGIGTTSPDALLSLSANSGETFNDNNVFEIASSTAAATTTLFSIANTGNAVLAGTLTQNSDERLKTNIQSLDASDSLAAINSLNPVSFNWADDLFGSGDQLGFLAQQVQPIFPQLVSTTSATTLTPNGTLGLNYTGLISPIVSAIQELSADFTSIESTISGFAQSFTTHILTGDDVTANNELCVGSTCVTPAQFQAMVAAANASQSSGEGSDSSGQSGAPSSTDSGDATDTPPVIQVNGDNPAIIQVGDAYNDLGATITGPQADLNLGIETLVNGSPMSPVQIDTSAAATDTIDYVVADQNGLTSTTTRIVIIEAPSIIPSDDASTTDTTTTYATSTAQ